MAQKNAKIDDVKRPEKVAPSATSRPILVSGQASAPADPMMVQEGGEKSEGEPVPMTHTAKTITPPSDLTADSEPEKEDTPEPEPVSEKPATESDTDATDAKPDAAKAPAEMASEEKEEESKQSTSTPSERADKAKAAQEGTDRDPDAAMSAEEAAAVEAKAKREEELEALIASEKYAVPINAVQRRRSRMHSLALGLLAALLLVALVDLVADVGIISLPSSIPHTQFFSGQ